MKKGFSALLGMVITASLASAYESKPIGYAQPRLVSVVSGVNSTLQGRSTISGTVFGEGNRPVPDVNVDLLDDFNSSINRAKTDNAGRFTFGSLPDGRYRVRVMPYGTDYLEQSQEVTIASLSTVTGGSGSDRQFIDIHLKVNERARYGPFAVAPGVIFAQEVPATAQKHYQEGLAYLRAKNEKEGLASLRTAIEIFPNYFDALDRLGAEYATRGTTDRSFLEAGFVLLAKAVEVNPQSVSSRFGLGWTQYQLGMNPEAIESFTRASTLYSKAPDVYLWLGKALKKSSKLDQAEAALKQANTLSKGKVPEIHWQLAGIYNEQKRYKEAADQFELFLKAEPKAADAEKIKVLIKQLRAKAAGQ